MPDLAALDDTIPADLEGVLAKTGAKDRTHIQKHLANCDAEGNAAHGALWRKLAQTLARLAPMPIQTIGHAAVMFFIADGKYRMQVFAMEDQNDGKISLYLPDVLAEALRKKILRKPESQSEYPIGGALRHTLRVESLDSHNTPEPPAHVKNMLGWNRKALRVVLPTVASDGPRLEAAEAMCALAAQQWGGQPKPVEPASPPAAAPVSRRATPGRDSGRRATATAAARPRKR